MEMQSVETTTIYCSDYTSKLWNMHTHRVTLTATDHLYLLFLRAMIVSHARMYLTDIDAMLSRYHAIKLLTRAME